MYAWARRPRAVPWLTLSRKISPVEIFGMDRCDDDELGLCPLARTGGAHEDETHYRRKPS